MKKNIILLLCVSTLSSMKRPLDPDTIYNAQASINVVALSPEAQTPTYCFPQSELWNKKYINPYNQKKPEPSTATTIYKKSIGIFGIPHINGDVATYDFAKKGITIKNVYIEQSENNAHIYKSMTNVHKAMPSNGNLIIELKPFCEIYADRKLLEVEELFNEKEISKDPLTAKIGLNFLTLALHTVAHNIEKTKERAENPLSPMLCERIKKLSKIFDDILTFYAANGVGNKDSLKERLNIEIMIFKGLIKMDNMILLPCKPSAGLEEFNQKFNKLKKTISLHCIFPKTLAAIGAEEIVRFTYETNENFVHHRDIKGIWYDLNSFSQETLFTHLIHDAYLTLYGEKITATINTTCGFKDATLTREKSPYNNRENVWLLHAKADKSEKFLPSDHANNFYHF